MKLNIGLLLVAGIVVLAVVAGPSILSPGAPLTIGGFTLLSFGTPIFQSSDPNGILSGQVYQFAVAQGGLGQSVSGSLNASQIPNASKGFTLNLQGTKSSCDYPILVDYTASKVYNFGLYKYAFGESDASAQTNCAKYGEVFSLGKTSGGFLADKYCVYRNTLSSYIGRLKESADYSFESKWTLTIDGSTPQSYAIRSQGAGTAYFGSVGYAKWVGNLSTGESCPSPSQQNVLAGYKNGNWGLINNNAYQSYLTQVALLQGSTTDFKQYVDNINNTYAPQALQGTNFISSQGNYATLSNQASVSSGSASIGLSNALQVPVFSLFVKAESLGFVQPVPIAKIVSAQGTTFKTGETGYLQVVYQNVGKDQGNFTVYASCNNGVTMQGARIERTLTANQTWTDSIPVTASASQPTSSSCTVHVSTLTQEATQSVQVNVSQQISCEPAGRLSCINNQVQQCNALQTGWTLKEDCAGQGKQCGTDLLGNLSCTQASQPATTTPSGTTVVPLTCAAGYHLQSATSGGFFGIGAGTTQTCTPDVDWAFVAMVIGALAVVLIFVRSFVSTKRRR